jgi:hypothetical protein
MRPRNAAVKIFENVQADIAAREAGGMAHAGHPDGENRVHGGAHEAEIEAAPQDGIRHVLQDRHGHVCDVAVTRLGRQSLARPFT